MVWVWGGVYVCRYVCTVTFMHGMQAHWCMYAWMYVCMRMCRYVYVHMFVDRGTDRDRDGQI